MTITGKKTAKVGETLNFECETGNSNPKASIQWVVDGRTIHENYTHWVRKICLVFHFMYFFFEIKRISQYCMGFNSNFPKYILGFANWNFMQKILIF